MKRTTFGEVLGCIALGVVIALVVVMILFY